MSSTSPQSSNQTAPIRTDNPMPAPDSVEREKLSADPVPARAPDTAHPADPPTPPPSLAEQHKKKAAIYGAFQKAFTSVATLPAIVGITQTVVPNGGDWTRDVMVYGISLFASFSLLAIGRGLRSELISEGYSDLKASVQSYSLMLGGLAALFFTVVYTGSP